MKDSQLIKLSNGKTIQGKIVENNEIITNNFIRNQCINNACELITVFYKGSWLYFNKKTKLELDTWRNGLLIKGGTAILQNNNC